MNIIEYIDSLKPELNINEKIARLTLYIEDEHPELYKFLEEMPITIPNETRPDINLAKLESYYESLILILNGSDKMHPTFVLFPDENHS